MFYLDFPWENAVEGLQTAINENRKNEYDWGLLNRYQIKTKTLLCSQFSIQITCILTEWVS